MYYHIYNDKIYYHEDIHILTTVVNNTDDGGSEVEAITK